MFGGNMKCHKLSHVKAELKIHNQQAYCIHYECDPRWLQSHQLSLCLFVENKVEQIMCC